MQEEGLAQGKPPIVYTEEQPGNRKAAGGN